MNPARRESPTLEEKAALCTGASNWTTKACPELGLRSLFMANGPYGVLVIDTDNDRSALAALKKAASAFSKILGLDDSPFLGKVRPSTNFPCSAAIACSWDEGLARRIGGAIGEECLAYGVDVLLGPGLNIKRSPLCGRNFEYYSEDPLLAGNIGSAFVEGLQSTGVAACVKHFALNNHETRRFSASAEADERTMREIYLRPFERVVKRAAPRSLMCSYNRVNGEFASQSAYLLDEVLRKDWGYEGLIMSDWGAVEDRAAALRAGLDLQMPGPRPEEEAALAAAAGAGGLDEALIDRSVARLRALARAAGPAGRRPGAEAGEEAFERRHALAVEAAAAGTVLLKNEGGLLPLDLGSLGSLALIGSAAESPNYLKGGSAFLSPRRLETPLAALQARLGPSRLVYAPGYDGSDRDDPALRAEAVAAARAAGCALIVARSAVGAYAEGLDRPDLLLPAAQAALIREVAAAQPRTAVAVICGSAFETGSWEGGVPSVLALWHGGEGMGEALARILFGEDEPGGRLAETFPLDLKDTPAYLSGPGPDDVVRYSEGVFVGYRWYDARAMAVAYPFGHGQGYARFEYSGLELGPSLLPAGAKASLRFRLRNVSGRAGSETAQVYLRDLESTFPRPERELRAFRKVRLEPGESAELSLDLPYEDFAFWDPRSRRWTVEAGDFEVLVGSSSRDLRLSGRVRVEGEEQREPLSLASPLRDWYADGRGRDALRKVFGPVMFGLMFDEASPLFPIIMSVPVRKAVKNNYLGEAKAAELLRLAGGA